MNGHVRLWNTKLQQRDLMPVLHRPVEPAAINGHSYVEPTTEMQDIGGQHQTGWSRHVVSPTRARLRLAPAARPSPGRRQGEGRGACAVGAGARDGRKG